MGIDSLANSILNNKGNFTSSKSNSGSKIIHPAIVISSEDPMGMRRIVAQIVSTDLDENGKPKPGKDRDTPVDQLPFAVPINSPFFHSVPIKGEMVYLILENPSDLSSTRYYIGPQINSPFRLKYQGFEEAVSVYKKTNFNSNITPSSNLEALTALPKEGDIAVQGRGDSDVILRPRECLLIAGKFKKGTLEINKETPCLINLKQLENDEDTDFIPRYSQTNIISTNINLYSPIGEFRDESLSKFELNDDLKSFGDIASKLHPSVKGDELVKLLDLIIKVLLNHIHTPQKPLLSISESNELSSYTIEGNLQRILSNYIRIN